MEWMKIFSNDLLVNAVISWLVAQLLKTVIYAIMNKTLDISRLVGDGGMPSGHSATVTALATTAAFECGLDSPVFAVAAILAIVVMHDAMGIRLEAGKHAQALNEIFRRLEEEMKVEKAPEVRLKEFLGHTPTQVVCGAILGFVIALVRS